MRERFGGRQMMIYTGLVNQFEPFTYAIWPSNFPMLLFWQIHDAVMGGISSAAGFAIGMDVLPVDPVR